MNRSASHLTRLSADVKPPLGIRGQRGRTALSALAVWFSRSVLDIRRPPHSFRPHHIYPAHIGLQLIRRSFIGGVSLRRIMAGACGARKGKVAAGPQRGKSNPRGGCKGRSRRAISGQERRYPDCRASLAMTCFTDFRRLRLPPLPAQGQALRGSSQ